MTKKNVVEKRLENFVLHDVEDGMLTFEVWWKTVEDDEVVEVQYPHERHGLAGRSSNHSKNEAMTDFLDFVDSVYFFVPKFTRIAPPTQGEKNYNEKAQSSVVSQFNKAQTERGKPTCGKTAAAEWLEKYRPKVALHPSMTDYCDTCKHLKEELSRNQAVLNRLHQSGSASSDELRAREATKQDLEDRLAEHKSTATKSREYYKTANANNSGIR